MGGFELVELFALLDDLGLGFIVGAFRIILALKLAPEGLVALRLFALGTFALIVWLYARLILGFSRGVWFLVRLVSARRARGNGIDRLFLADCIVKRRGLWLCIRIGAGIVFVVHRLYSNGLILFRSDLTQTYFGVRCKSE